MKPESRSEAVFLTIAFAVMLLLAGTAPSLLQQRDTASFRIFALAPWQVGCLVLFAILASLAYRIGDAVALRLGSIGDQRASGVTFDRRLLRRAGGIILATLTLLPYQPELQLPDVYDRDTVVVLHASLVVGIVLLVIALWDALCDRIAHQASNNDRAERLLVPVTRKLVRVVIIVAGGMVAIGVFGVNIAGLLAGLGLGGLVVALAAKDSVENIFGSLTILFDMPFALGDWVKIDKVEGVVEVINLRSTRVRTFDDTLINLPNANLIRAAVENYGARRTRRQKIYVRLPYDSPPENITRFCDLVSAHLATIPEVAPDRSLVVLTEFNDTTLSILVQTYFVADTQAVELGLRHNLMLNLMRIAKQSNLALIPTPGASPLPEVEQ